MTYVAGSRNGSRGTVNSTEVAPLAELCSGLFCLLQQGHASFASAAAETLD